MVSDKSIKMRLLQHLKFKSQRSC